VPQQPAKRKIITFNISAAEQFSSNFFYYLVLDTSNPPSVEGPLPILSGPERAKNWSYYIRLYNGEFTEKTISSDTDKDQLPLPFNAVSLRYFQAVVTGATLILSFYLDQLPAPAGSFSFNIITSEQPLTPTDQNIPAIDYFIQPKVTVSTATGANANSTLYNLSSSHTVSDARLKPADVTAWSVEVYER
jgi:hypothetical protein